VEFQPLNFVLRNVGGKALVNGPVLTSIMRMNVVECVHFTILPKRKMKKDEFGMQLRDMEAKTNSSFHDISRSTFPTSQ